MQAEFARTEVFDRPVAGRVFFEEVMRETSTWDDPTTWYDGVVGLYAMATLSGRSPPMRQQIDRGRRAIRNRR